MLKQKGGALMTISEQPRINPLLLKKAREEKKLILREVSEKLGFKSESMLSKRENGVYKFSIEELFFLARLYEKPLEYFFVNDLPK